MSDITRFSNTLEDVTVDTVLADCKAFPFSGYASGRILIPSGSSITSLTFHESQTEDGTFVACYDDTATTPVAIALTGCAASRSYPIPAKLYGARWLKMVGNADGVVDIVLKG